MLYWWNDLQFPFESVALPCVLRLVTGRHSGGAPSPAKYGACISWQNCKINLHNPAVFVLMIFMNYPIFYLSPRVRHRCVFVISLDG